MSEKKWGDPEDIRTAREAYAALSGQGIDESKTWIIRTPNDLEGLYWQITASLRLGEIVEVMVKVRP